MVKVALIGCGAWGQYILRDLKLAGATVEVLARSTESIVRAKQYGADRLINSIKEISTVDGVVVAIPVDRAAKILDQLITATEAPIFTEKPLCCDLSAAQAIVARASTRLFVMDKWRYHPGVLAIAEMLHSGRLGEPIGLATRRLGWGHLHVGSDAIWMLCPHDLAISQEIFGTIPPVTAAVTDFLDGEATGIQMICQGTPWLSVSVSVRHAERERSVTLYTSEGVVRLRDGYSDHIEILRGSTSQRNPTIERHAIALTMPLYAEIEAFLNFLKGGPPPKSSAKEALRVVEVIAQARAICNLDALACQ